MALNGFQARGPRHDDQWFNAARAVAWSRLQQFLSEDDEPEEDTWWFQGNPPHAERRRPTTRAPELPDPDTSDWN